MTGMCLQRMNPSLSMIRFWPRKEDGRLLKRKDPQLQLVVLITRQSFMVYYFWMVNNYLDNTKDSTVNLLLHILRIRKKFNKFILFADRAAQHRSKMVEEYLRRNIETIKIEYFHVGSPQLNAVEECWRQGKYNTIKLLL